MLFDGEVKVKSAYQWRGRVHITGHGRARSVDYEIARSNADRDVPRLRLMQGLHVSDDEMKASTFI